MMRWAITFLFYVMLSCAAMAQGGMMPGPGTAHSSGGATAPVFAWQNTSDNSFFGSATQTDVGFSAPLGSCGSITAGMFLVAGVVTQGNTSDTVGIPAGWTALGSQVTTSGSNVVKAAYKIATGSETCGSGGIRFTWTTSSFSSWFIMAYTGANATPLDGTPATTTFATAGSTTFSMSGPTTSSATDALIAVVLGDSNASITTSGGTLTQRFSVQQESGTVGSMGADRTLSATGAQSDTFTQATFKTGSYVMFAIKP